MPYLKKYAVPAVIHGSYTLEEVASEWDVEPSTVEKLVSETVSIPSGASRANRALLPFVLKQGDKRKLVRQLYDEGVSIDVLAQYVPRSLIYRWLEDVIAERKRRDSEEKLSAHSKCAAEAQQQADAVYVERKPVPSIVSSVVNLSYRQEKFRIRRDLLTLIKEDLPAAISALTLPGSEWLMERDILWSVPDRNPCSAQAPGFRHGDSAVK